MTLKNRRTIGVEIITEGHPSWEEYTRRAEETDRICHEKNARMIGPDVEARAKDRAEAFQISLDQAREEIRYEDWLGYGRELEVELEEAGLM